MKLLPYHRFALDFAESPAELGARLRTFVSRPQWFGWPWSGNTFTGYVDGLTFRIWLNLSGTNRRGAAAILCGEIVEHPAGSRLMASARPPYLWQVVLALMLLIEIPATVLTIFRVLEGAIPALVLLIPTFMIVTLVGVTVGGFHYMLKRSKQQLEACLRFRPTLVPPTEDHTLEPDTPTTAN